MSDTPQSTNNPSATEEISSTAAPVNVARGGVSRVLGKLEASVEAGNYYEAHQMYRTLYFRYLTQKRYDDCLDLLYKGSVKFLQNEQFTSGADLGILVVDTLEKRGTKTEVADDLELWIERICKLIRMINASVVERETLRARALKWSSDASKNKRGHPLMHKLAAQIMWNEGNVDQAHNHFIFSRDGEGFGRMLVELSQTKGLPSEVDLFIVQVVLQQLCVKEKASAVDTFNTYTKYHPKIACAEPPFPMPLLNFVYFLLKSIETGKLPMFRTLCDMYKVSLARDSSYDKYLQKIGVLFFGVVPTQQRSGGMFGDLINQLFSSLDDGEDEADDDDEFGANSGTTSVDVDLD